MILPALIRIMVAQQEGKRISLWIPVILLWPLIILALAVVPVAAMFHPAWRRKLGAKSALASGYCLYTAACALRGLMIRVNSDKDNVHIAFY